MLSCSLTLEQLVCRFFLLIEFIICGIVAGQPLIALLAVPVFLSALLCVSFMPEQKATSIKTMNESKTQAKQAA